MIDQEILKHAKPIKTSIIATSARSQKRYLLPENDTITSTFHNETLTVKHKPGSKIISNLKKLKWAFSDLTSRNLTHTDIQDDFKLPESYDRSRQQWPRPFIHTFSTIIASSVSWRRRSAVKITPLMSPYCEIASMLYREHDGCIGQCDVMNFPNPFWYSLRNV